MNPECPSTSLPPTLQAMTQYVENHLAERLSLQDLVYFSSLSPSGIGRLFKRHAGCTPVEWITRAKINRAKHLLSTSRLQVSEVGRRLGIYDPYYFSKLFKKTAGISPLQFRKQTSLL